MLGFGFYSFGFLNPETIEKLISREDLTMEELLDEDNIVQEIKGSSEKFGNFMGHRPELIKEMLNYIIVEPDEIELDYKKCYKYPFISSEIFYAEIDGIINAFFDEKPNQSVIHETTEDHEHNENSSSDKNANEENSDNSMENADNSEGITNPYEKPKEEETANKEEFTEKEEEKNQEDSAAKFELMAHLFTFLQAKEKPLNVTSVGYFAKLINALLNKRFLETLNYLMNNYDVLLDFIERIGYKSIGDIIGRIVLMDIPFLEDYNANNNMLFPELRKKLLSEILLKFEKTENFDEMSNIVFILNEMLNKYDRINYGKELVEHFMESNLNCFFISLQDTSNMKATHALSLLNTLLDFFLVKTEQQTQKPIPQHSDNDEMEKPPLVEINLELFNLKLKELIELSAPLILELLTIDPEKPEFIETMHGEKVRPLKPIVMKLIDYLNLVLKIEGLVKFESLICEKNLFEVLWNLMISHQWNNLLHCKIEKTVISVIKSVNLLYKKNLFEKAGLLDRIIKEMSDLEFVMPGDHKRRMKKGFIGFITNISNELVSQSILDSFIKEQMKKNKNWEVYHKTVLKKINSNNDRYLAGYDPRKSNNFELNMEKLPFYFEQKTNNKEEDEEEEEEDLNNRDQEQPKPTLFEDIIYNNPQNPGEEIEENIPDEEKDHEQMVSEPFRLSDHIEINEEQDLQKNKFQEEENQEYLANNFWKLTLDVRNIDKIIKEFTS